MATKKVAKKETKKQAKQKDSRRMLAPIYLDDGDQESLENLRVWLWARSKQDAILHSLRWAVKVVRKSKGYHKPFVRESDRAWADGVTLTIRVTEEQRRYLEEFGEATGCDSNAESVRLIIRMAEHFFSRS